MFPYTFPCRQLSDNGWQEKRLQEEIDSEAKATNTYSVVNRALHSVAAHLHRYGSELKAIQDTLADIMHAYREFGKSRHEDYANAEKLSHTSFDQITTQVKQVKAFRWELEVKLQNILALVSFASCVLRVASVGMIDTTQLFNRIQITNDRMMVANGEKMHSILVATQEDAKISRLIALRSKNLAEEMKEDSVAMKTVGHLLDLRGLGLMCPDCRHYHVFSSWHFLRSKCPRRSLFGWKLTLIEAFLAMPFFNTNTYLTEASKLWIWIVCTVPATLAAFGFYTYWRRNDSLRRGRREPREEETQSYEIT